MWLFHGEYNIISERRVCMAFSNKLITVQVFHDKSIKKYGHSSKSVINIDPQISKRYFVCLYSFKGQRFLIHVIKKK